VTSETNQPLTQSVNASTQPSTQTLRTATSQQQLIASAVALQYNKECSNRLGASSDHAQQRLLLLLLLLKPQEQADQFRTYNSGWLPCPAAVIRS
jgi:hypothetical protein